MYLHSTMTHMKLNGIILTYKIHKELTNKLDSLETGNKFTATSNHRYNTLG